MDEWKNEKGEGKLGGTCLNVGCIPSKALLESSENYERVAYKFGNHGISVTGAKIDVAKMQARKDKIVSQLTGGIEALFRKNKITWLKGHGKFAGSGEKYLIEVSDGGSAEIVEANHVILATGSAARHLPGLEVDNVTICDNVGALAFNAVPEKLGVIGAGVIGRTGQRVAAPGRQGHHSGSFAQFSWRRGRCGGQGSVEGVRQGAGAGDQARRENRQGKPRQAGGRWNETADGKQALDCNKLVVSIGRSPNTANLGAETVGLKIDERGFIEVDENCRTSLPNVYAVGDVVRGPMLAHKGMDEGVMAAERIAGQAAYVNLDTIPWVVYTAPEIAWVGKTEQQLKARRGLPRRPGAVRA